MKKFIASLLIASWALVALHFDAAHCDSLHQAHAACQVCAAQRAMPVALSAGAPPRLHCDARSTPFQARAAAARRAGPLLRFDSRAPPAHSPR